jgi:hypothetical protein
MIGREREREREREQMMIWSVRFYIDLEKALTLTLII